MLIFAFYFVNIISATWALNATDAIFESQKIALGILLFIWVYDQISSAINERFILNTLSIVFFTTLCITFYEWSIQINEFKTSIFGHKNLLSSFLFLSLAFWLYCFRVVTNRLKWVYLIGFILTVSCILLIQTRSAILALIVAVFFFIMTCIYAHLKLKARRIFLTTISATFLIVAFYGSKHFTNILSNTNDKNASLVERVELWKNTTELIKENPIIGVGTGNWQYNYSKFSINNIDKARNYNTFFKRPHNDFLWVLSENGIIGFVLLICIIGYIGRVSIKMFLIDKDINRLILLSGAVGFIMISFFSFPKERVPHIILVAILLAFQFKGIHFDHAKKLKLNFKNVFVIIALLLLNCTIGYYRLKGEFYTKKAVLAQTSKEADKVIEFGTKAISYFYTTDPSGTPIYSYIGWGYNLKTDLNELLSANEKAYQISPYDYKVLSNYGYALLRIGLFDSASKVLSEAYRINSSYEPILLNLSVLEFNRRNYALSLEWLEKIENYQIKYAQNYERIQMKISAK
ncbi:O-antigen ligase family protein [Crocinitomix catalasitica]|uniref:O-antigen ligase family protein n=1 Tax=Crocinitomix catalasitica TaxID=184607 RepID=UPI00146FB24E|nr:O-antigen ligase family protein [Crocinitomix catalasitica]